MKLMDVYAKIQSPFSDEAIKNIIAGKNVNGGTRNTLDYAELNKDFQVRNDLFVDVYNVWVKEFFALDDEQLALLVGKQNVDSAKKLREKIKEMPPVKDYTNLKNVEKALFDYDDDLAFITSKCYWDKMEDGYNLLYSNKILCKNKPVPVRHILSLEISQEFLNRFVRLLFKEFGENNVHCNIRFSQDTTVEIQANNENLGQIIEIIESLKVKNPEIYSKIKDNRNPLGLIDGKIGYRNIADDSQVTIRETLEKVTPERIIVDNLKTKFQYGKITTDITNILKSRLASLILQKLEQDLRMGHKVDYTFEELKSNDFQAKVLNESGNVVNAWLEQLKNGEKLGEVTAFILNKKKETIILSLSPTDLKIVLSVIPEIRDYVKKFIETCLRERGYDEKRCISLETIEKMKEYDKGLGSPAVIPKPVQPKIVKSGQPAVLKNNSKPKDLDPVIPIKTETSQKPTFIHRPIVKPKNITSTPYQLPSEANISVKLNPILKAKTITLFYPEIDGDTPRFFISREDAIEVNVEPIIDPYQKFVPVTLEEIARLNAAPNINIQKRPYNFPKPELMIQFDKRDGINCYLTNDYVIQSIGLKGILNSNEEVNGKEIALSLEQYELLKIYYDVKLVPAFGTFDFSDDSGYNFSGSSVLK